MDLKISTRDPLKILSSTKRVIENSEYVHFNLDKISEVSELVKNQIAEGVSGEEAAVGGFTGNYNNDVQLAFIRDVVNFCFWAEKDQPKWQIEWPKGETVAGGAYCLNACFKRALAEKIPILEAEYLAKMKMSEAQNFFRSSNDAEIPLVKKRLENLNETGRILQKRFHGHFINVLNLARRDAIELVRLIFDNFPSFRDVSKYRGRSVYFLKRAQIVAYDLSYLKKNEHSEKLHHLDQLTAFADYKLPQILRMFGLTVYSNKLAEKVDGFLLIPAGSREEIEIRAHTIWGIELIRQELKKYSSGQIDNALWFLSQDLSKQSKPYHRTYTKFY